VQPLLSSPARGLAWLVVALGALLLALNAGELAADARQQLSAPRVLLVMWLVYPLLKAVHELAHAFTIKAHGGDVVEIGVTC
jgi:putative peptide zinc metalloprotease protein